jgi:hypothetical protein
MKKRKIILFLFLNNLKIILKREDIYYKTTFLIFVFLGKGYLYVAALIRWSLIAARHPVKHQTK